jgi:hypothetical protein
MQPPPPPNNDRVGRRRAGGRKKKISLIVVKARDMNVRSKAKANNQKSAPDYKSVSGMTSKTGISEGARINNLNQDIN